MCFHRRERTFERALFLLKKFSLRLRGDNGGTRGTSVVLAFLIFPLPTSQSEGTIP